MRTRRDKKKTGDEEIGEGEDDGKNEKEGRSRTKIGGKDKAIIALKKETENDVGEAISRTSVIPTLMTQPKIEKRKKKKRKKTRSRQKNMKKDTRPHHLKPTYLTPGSADYDPTRPRSGNPGGGGQKGVKKRDAKDTEEASNDAFFENSANQVWT